MDINSGKIMDLDTPAGKAMYDALRANGRDVRPVPPELQADAEAALAGDDVVEIDMTHEPGPLAKWAKKQRCKRAMRSKDARRQMAKASRQRNRGRQ